MKGFEGLLKVDVPSPTLAARATILSRTFTLSAEIFPAKSQASVLLGVSAQARFLRDDLRVVCNKEWKTPALQLEIAVGLASTMDAVADGFGAKVHYRRLNVREGALCCDH